MSNTSEEDRWKIADQNIEDIKSLTDLETRTTDLYDLKFCYPDNNGALHVIGGYLQKKKENCIQSMFKFNYPSILSFLLSFGPVSKAPTLTHYGMV